MDISVETVYLFSENPGRKFRGQKVRNEKSWTKSQGSFLLSDKKSENINLSIMSMYYINVILYYIVSSYIINTYFKNVIVVPTFIILLYFFL